VGESNISAYLFVIYFTMLSLTQTVALSDRMIVNDELERNRPWTNLR
jgi:hypothetical protein